MGTGERRCSILPWWSSSGIILPPLGGICKAIDGACSNQAYAPHRRLPRLGDNGDGGPYVADLLLDEIQVDSQSG